MLGCEIPLTPDQGEARDWLLEELSKGVYGEISGPIVSFVSDLIDGFFRLLSWRGEGTPPISLILTILAIIAIAALIVVLILHPIRLAKRRSRSVFEEETSAPQVRASFDEAVASQDWNLAYVWAYRLMVLGLDDHDVVSSTPGLTAREAADAATCPTAVHLRRDFRQGALRSLHDHSRGGGCAAFLHANPPRFV